jgi:hypothetical protein
MSGLYVIHAKKFGLKGPSSGLPLKGAVAHFKLDCFVKSILPFLFVIPAKAGIQLFEALLDSRFRGSDVVFDFFRFYQTYLFIFSFIIGNFQSGEVAGTHFSNIVPGFTPFLAF